MLFFFVLLRLFYYASNGIVCINEVFHLFTSGYTFRSLNNLQHGIFRAFILAYSIVYLYWYRLSKIDTLGLAKSVLMLKKRKSLNYLLPKYHLHKWSGIDFLFLGNCSRTNPWIHLIRKNSSFNLWVKIYGFWYFGLFSDTFACLVFCQFIFLRKGEFSWLWKKPNCKVLQDNTSPAHHSLPFVCKMRMLNKR